MATGKPRDPCKEQLWRQRIRQWRSSGLSVRAFCEQHGLAIPSFYAWRRVLQERQAEQACFLPVHVLPDNPKTLDSAIELLLPGGRSLRVAAGFDTTTLRQLLAVLEDGSC